MSKLPIGILGSGKGSNCRAILEKIRIGELAAEVSVRVAAELRGAGVSAVAAAGGKSLKAQLRQANALGVNYAVIIGEDEVRAGTAVLRRMADASQETLALKDLPAAIKFKS